MGSPWTQKIRTRKAFAPRSMQRWRENRRHDRIAISHHSLHGSGHCCGGRSGRCNLSQCAGAHWRDHQLRRVTRLFPGIGQFVRKGRRRPSRVAWRVRLFLCICFRYVCSVWLHASPNVSHSDDWRNVSGYALVLVCAGLRAARLLPLLFVLSGNHISYCRPDDSRTTLTTPVWQMSRMLVYRQ